MPEVDDDEPRFGWRCWRLCINHAGVLRLRNPWTNSGLLVEWQPGAQQVASCFYSERQVFGRRRDEVCTFRTRVGPDCTCGIRSMVTLGDLVHFMNHDGQVSRHPAKVSVVGRVQVGGRVQTRIPGLPALRGYQRSEFAWLEGPLFVSPLAAPFAAEIARQYAPVEVVAPPADLDLQAWFDQLPAAACRY